MPLSCLGGQKKKKSLLFIKQNLNLIPHTRPSINGTNLSFLFTFPHSILLSLFSKYSPIFLFCAVFFYLFHSPHPGTSFSLLYTFILKYHLKQYITQSIRLCQTEKIVPFQHEDNISSVLVSVETSLCRYTQIYIDQPIYRQIQLPKSRDPPMQIQVGFLALKFYLKSQ